jgi:hypothetical protein
MLGAYWATPIRNLEVEIRVTRLGIHLDSLQAQFRVRFEKSEIVKAIKEALGWVEKLTEVAEGEASGRRRTKAKGKNHKNSRGEIMLGGALNDGRRSRTAAEDRGSKKGNWEESTTRGAPQKIPTTSY